MTKKNIPAPDTDHNSLAKETDTELSPYIVNDMGRFCIVFSDEETAKEMVSTELKQIIYPYLSILSEEEGAEWNRFVDEMIYAECIEIMLSEEPREDV